MIAAQPGLPALVKIFHSPAITRTATKSPTIEPMPPPAAAPSSTWARIVRIVSMGGCSFVKCLVVLIEERDSYASLRPNIFIIREYARHVDSNSIAVLLLSCHKSLLGDSLE